MANLAAIFLSCAILPLLVSADVGILQGVQNDINTIVEGSLGGLQPIPVPLQPQPIPVPHHPQPIPVPVEPQPIPVPLQPQPIPVPEKPQPIPVPLQPQPIPVPLQPQPIPEFKLPQPVPVHEEPQPIPVPLQPQPIPVPLQPQPIPVPLQPQPIPVPLQPQPIPVPLQPQPIPVPLQPQPIPVPGEPQPIPGTLQEGFYQQSCPQAETIVKEVITEIFEKDPTIAPALVRLFFHDCIVTGCDASILLDKTPSGEDVEKNAPQNGIFVRGYEAIDEIKAKLEAECPGIVSCADVLAFTNRDSLVHTGVPNFNVAAGRRDGLASLAKNGEANIPVPENTAQQMMELFQRKGMTVEELVVLIGAHSIGAAHCSVVTGRFRDPEKSKMIDRGYLTKMQVMTMCLDDTQDVAFDPYSQQKMDSRFYKELLKNRALLESDQNLALDPMANIFMKKYVNDQLGWLASFTAAITKLGGLEVLTGNQGEIRKQCRFVN